MGSRARLGAALGRVGYPDTRIRERGYRTLLRTIVGQQVSVAAATSMWNKLEAELGEDIAPDALLARDFDTLRACGLSRQKQGYARSLCERVGSGARDLDNLPADDEEARLIEAGRTSLKGQLRQARAARAQAANAHLPSGRRRLQQQKRRCSPFQIQLEHLS